MIARFGRCIVYAVQTLVTLATLAGVVLAVAWHVCPFPRETLHRFAASPRVVDVEGRVLADRVADDGQWRTPVPLDEMSPWLAQATVAVEDERFWEHHGVDVISVGRAVGQNLVAGETVSGASTITMQLCRMLDDRPRTWEAKASESLRALQLEALWDKRQILQAYLNIAPYGGNVRGVEAASRAYFGKSAKDLSLGEAALDRKSVV